MKKIPKIHKEGYKILAVTGLGLIVINMVIEFLLPSLNLLQIIIGGFSTILFTACVAFFRVPRLTSVELENGVIAPADGRVVAIEEVEETEYFKEKRIQVSIFMSPANVHVNRNPIAGTVKYAKYHPGKYLVAWHPKSSTKNEAHSVVIENPEFGILIKQIAGMVARRIVNYLDVGDEVKQGAELGFIKFGSRVDLLLPLGTEILVDLQERVKGGITVIGKFDESLNLVSN